MLQAMYNGVSGLSAEQQWMDTIGNNIANVNTTGYKASDVSFEDQLSQTLRGASQAGTNVGGTNAVQIGLGVKLASIGVDTSQGGLQATSKPTDMAVSGNGYFMVGDGASVNYTRDGSFALDNQGNLVSAATGGYVLGWTADPTTGQINSSTQIDGSSHLQIPIGGLTITNATTKAAFAGNLSADPNAATNPTGTYVRSINMYDSLGEKQPVTLTFNNLGVAPSPTAAANTTGNLTAGAHTVKVTFVYPDGGTGVESAAYTKNVTTAASGSIDLTNIQVPSTASGFNVYVDGAMVNTTGPLTGTTYTATDPGTGAAPPATPTNEWSWSATDAGGNGIGGGSVQFDQSGKESGQTGSVSLPTVDGSVTPLTVAMDFSALTQISGASSAAPSSQDGTPPGTLNGFNVDSTGTITGTFSNGMTRALGQVALANFQNPAGLSRNGNNEFSLTPNSGSPTIGAAGSNGLGGIAAGFTEQSNVDLSKEFSNLIVSQRGFEANTKIVSTVDTLLSDVIHLVQ